MSQLALEHHRNSAAPDFSLVDRLLAWGLFALFLLGFDAPDKDSLLLSVRTNTPEKLNTEQSP